MVGPTPVRVEVVGCTIPKVGPNAGIVVKVKVLGAATVLVGVHICCGVLGHVKWLVAVIEAPLSTRTIVRIEKADLGNWSQGRCAGRLGGDTGHITGDGRRLGAWVSRWGATWLRAWDGRGMSAQLLAWDGRGLSAWSCGRLTARLS